MYSWRNSVEQMIPLCLLDVILFETKSAELSSFSAVPNETRSIIAGAWQTIECWGSNSELYVYHSPRPCTISQTIGCGLNERQKQNFFLKIWKACKQADRIKTKMSYTTSGSRKQNLENPGLSNSITAVNLLVITPWRICLSYHHQKQ